MARYKAVAIGGVPATGKSTLMRNIISKKSVSMTSWKYGLVNGYLLDGICSIGTYPKDEKFGGTDRLSMAAPKDMMKFMEFNKYGFIFEGDRLFTNAILKKAMELYDLKIIILEQDHETLEDRHIMRGDNQSEKFLKGRKTKIENIKNDEVLSKIIELYTLENYTETEHLSNKIIKYLW